LERAFAKHINPFCTFGYFDDGFKASRYDQYIEGTIKINGEEYGSFWKGLDIEKVKCHATPAPFGLNQETIIDENVRKALEIPGSSIEIMDKQKLTTGNLPLEYPLAYQKLKKVLYMMNIYEAPGGKFEFHQDTPHGKFHHASLVVCLPT
jgi:hypothetical protein